MLHFDDPKQFDGKSNAVRCSRTIPILEVMMPDRSVQKCGTFIWLFILIRFHEGRSWYTVGVSGNINHDIPVICPMFGQTWTHTFRMDWNYSRADPMPMLRILCACWGVSLVWTILREWETVVDILQLGASCRTGGQSETGVCPQDCHSTGETINYGWWLLIINYILR